MAPIEVSSNMSVIRYRTLTWFDFSCSTSDTTRLWERCNVHLVWSRHTHTIDTAISEGNYREKERDSPPTEYSLHYVKYAVAEAERVTSITAGVEALRLRSLNHCSTVARTTPM